MNSQRRVEKLRSALAEVVGSECWNTSAVRKKHPVILLQFGEKVPRRKKLHHPFISREGRAFEAEFGLLVLAAWRLDNGREVVCGAWHERGAAEFGLEGLAQVRGKRLDAFELGQVGLDLVLHFSGQLRLKVFCDHVDQEDQGDNYVLTTRNGIYIVGSRSQLYLETPDAGEGVVLR